MNTSKIYVRRIQNLTSRFVKHNIYIDGACVEYVKCGERKSIIVDSEREHTIHIEEGRYLRTNSFKIYCESGKEYCFESGWFIEGDGLKLCYHGNQFDESGAAPIEKGFRAVKSLFSKD